MIKFCFALFLIYSKALLGLSSQISITRDTLSRYLPQQIELMISLGAKVDTNVSDEIASLLGPLDIDETTLQNALKRFQRLTLQLDRSDGRSDLAAEVLADRFKDFIATCLRCEGAAWTNAVGGLDYIGLKLPSYIALNEGAYVIDFPAICKSSAQLLLDLDSPAKQTAAAQNSVKHAKICDFHVALLRLSLRAALARGDPEVNMLKVLTTPGDIVPSASVLQHVINLDLQCSSSLYEIEYYGASLIEIPCNEIKTQISRSK